MNPLFERTARVIGTDGVERLATKTVAVFGLGGVGSYAAEALGRAGVGHLLLIDKDVVDETNMNRQLVADKSTLGRKKAEVMAERIHQVNPDCEVRVLVKRFTPDDMDFIPSLEADFIIDAIDDVPAKIALITASQALHIPLIASMGTGNRLHPECLQIADISKTDTCPLARKIRKALKARQVKHVPVVYSTEVPLKPQGEGATPGSLSFVPPVSGMLMAGYAVRTLLDKNE